MARLVGDMDVEATLAGLLTPGDRVVVANPVDPDVLAAIVAVGARYVDAGRDHVFAIDPGGWRFAVRQPGVRLAYLPTPNWPTATLPLRQRFEEAEAAGVDVLEDARHAATEWLWVRVPGVASSQIARGAASPSVVGSGDWTWRDAVVVAGPDRASVATSLRVGRPLRLPVE